MGSSLDERSIVDFVSTRRSRENVPSDTISDGEKFMDDRWNIDLLEISRAEHFRDICR
ncbi:MAG TPA: hypothetical protein VNQ76_05205 [Planctomicrobium sp.]|nr:hypothetical protein [Planctomicrobium sp.]